MIRFCTSPWSRSPATSKGARKTRPLHHVGRRGKRTGRDSNPRSPYKRLVGLANRCLQPLGHLSKELRNVIEVGLYQSRPNRRQPSNRVHVGAPRGAIHRIRRHPSNTHRIRRKRAKEWPSVHLDSSMKSRRKEWFRFRRLVEFLLVSSTHQGSLPPSGSLMIGHTTSHAAVVDGCPR